MRARWIRVAVWAALAICSLTACIMTDKGYSYWALNDSDAQVTIDVHAGLVQTWVLPPHTYGALLDGLGQPHPDWTVTIVDATCRPAQTFPVDAAQNLIYIDPSGNGILTADHPWSHGLASAKQAALVQRSPPCL